MSRDTSLHFGLGPSPDALAHECDACGAVYYGVGAALACCGGRLGGASR